MFSGVLEKENEYPAFVESPRKTFERVVDIVRACQSAGVLHPAPVEVMAVTVWGQLHGIVSLFLEGPISHTVLDRYAVNNIINFAIKQMVIE